MKAMKKVTEILCQEHLALMFRATDTGGTDELRCLSSRKLAGAVDKCGRTILHKAILNKKKDMIKFIVQNYPHIIDMQDSVGIFSLYVERYNDNHASSLNVVLRYM